MLRVMSANLRCQIDDTTVGEPDHWPTRLPAMAALLKSRRPGLVGTQEGSRAQLDALLDELPNLAMVGEGREGGERGEHCAIVYDRDQLKVLDWRQWWLSETPEVVGSRSWGTACTRIATLARFRMRATGAEIVLVNTHLDHESELARVEGARLVASRLPDDLPVLVTGDFNCLAGDCQAWRVLTGSGLRDAWLAADHRGPEIDTFHDYAEPSSHSPAERIDWILASTHWTVDRAQVVTERPDGVWPSDHWPVEADLRLAGSVGDGA